MSSNGLRLATQEEVGSGAHLEVHLAWPWPLDSGARLKLVVTGRVARREPGAFALEIVKYEFRTRKQDVEGGAG
jgi:hypothetical protein